MIEQMWCGMCGKPLDFVTAWVRPKYDGTDDGRSLHGGYYHWRMAVCKECA